MSSQLTAQEITAILQGDYFSSRGYPAPEQHGPLTYSEKEKPCLHTGYYVGGILHDTDEHGGARRGCHSPTNWRFKGAPICTVHALRKMNALLYEVEQEREGT